ncbi:MAG: hypothetical protein ACREFC_03365 [Stellaceae bacterium]
MQAPSLEPSEIIRRVTVQVLKQRVGLLGVDRSGAYEHYGLLLSRGFPLPAYDRAIPDFIARRLPDQRSYHVIGSGLGTLPLLLACEGFAAVGVERDEPRHLTATAILRGLLEQMPDIEGRCRLIGAGFPEAVADLDPSESMAIVTDFVSTHSPAEYAALCHGLARYRYVLIDLQRFCLKRDTEAERAELIGDLSRFGLVASAESIDLGSEGCYRLFESRLTARREDMLRRQIDMPEAKVGADDVVARAPANDTPREIPSGGVTLATLPPRPRRVRPRRFGGLAGISALLVIGIPTILGIAYFGFIAAGQFVTTFEFAVRGADVEQERKSMSSASAMSPDAFIVSDYINSPQAAEDVKPYVDPLAMFSRPEADFLTGLSPGSSDDQVDSYWRRMVNAQFDVVSGNVIVMVRAFSARDSLDLANAVIAASNTMFGKLNQDAAHDFVKLADENLSRTEKRLNEARTATRTFRAKHGLLQPDKVVAANSTLADDLRHELAGVRTQYAAVLSASPRSPTLEILRARITAVEAAIGRIDGMQTSSLTPSVTPSDLEQYESLDANSQSAEKLYAEALELREKAYLTASSQQSYLALFVKPKLARTALYPNRVASIVIVILAAIAAVFVGLMVTYAVKDHLI